LFETTTPKLEKRKECPKFQENRNQNSSYNVTNAEFVPAKQVQNVFAVCTKTLRTWADKGLVSTVRLGENGKRLYKAEDIKRLLGSTSQETTHRTKRFIYVRVSSAHQKGDLHRQVSDLQTAYPGYETITDIASGLNYKRKGLQTLLEQVLEGVVEQVVVMHKDRLCRFGWDLLEFIFTKASTKLVVHGGAVHEGLTGELADDLLAVTTVFVAKNNGLRAAQNRKRRREESLAEN
tara:strand:- start:381 stop:1085 length:705 start_codon:yes stop_codon:yes gene_type:complete